VKRVFIGRIWKEEDFRKKKNLSLSTEVWWSIPDSIPKTSTMRM